MKVIKTTPLYKKYVKLAKHSIVVQIGGRFSAKSHNEQIRLAANLGMKENYKLLVIENLETGMADGFHAGLRERLKEFEHDPAYNDKSRTAYIKNNINGNEAIFKGYTSDVQKLNVKRLSGVTEIIVEEGEWMDFQDLIALYQQMRGGKEEDRRLTVLMNPVNPDCFANTYLVEAPPQKIYERFPDGRPKVFERHIKVKYKLNGKEESETLNILVVMSTHHDNPYLTGLQRASIEQYKDTDPEMYAQLGECKFIRPSGTYFKEFNFGVHVKDPEPIPDNWTRYRAIDYGLDMLACLWIAVSPNNQKVIVYKELHEKDLIISKAAERIKQVNGNDKIRHTYAPPDLWSRTKDTGKSIEQTFKENGVSLYKTSNRRIDGWLAIKELLQVFDNTDVHTGETYPDSKLIIHSNCVNLIKNLPKIQRDEKNPNDCANDPHDITHILDSLRAYAITRSNGNKQEEKPKKAHDKAFMDAMMKWG